MSEDRNLETQERYAAKLYKYTKESTWKFSSSQLIVDGIIALAITLLSYYAGILTSVWSTMLVIVCAYVGAMLLTVLINLLRAPAAIDKERSEEIARLRQQLPNAAARRPPAPLDRPEARPNIVCPAAGFTQVNIDDNDIVRRGWNHITIVAQFVNQPRADRHISSENYVMARMTYYDADGSVCQRVNHGSWIDEEWRWVEFDVGDTRHLVLAVQLTDGERLDPELTTLRAIQNNHESVDRYHVPDYPSLPPTTSRAEVLLFSGENGAIIGQFAFEFHFGEESYVTIVAPSDEPLAN